MIAISNEKIRPQRSLKLWWCPKCDATFSRNTGGWMKGYRTDNGTAGDGFVKTGDVPADICPMCENKNIKPPQD